MIKTVEDITISNFTFSAQANITTFYGLSETAGNVVLENITFTLNLNSSSEVASLSNSVNSLKIDTFTVTIDLNSTGSNNYYGLIKTSTLENSSVNNIHITGEILGTFIPLSIAS